MSTNVVEGYKAQKLTPEQKAANKARLEELRKADRERYFKGNAKLAADAAAQDAAATKMRAAAASVANLPKTNVTDILKDVLIKW
jgi:hypothetical protein